LQEVEERLVRNPPVHNPAVSALVTVLAWVKRTSCRLLIDWQRRAKARGLGSHVEYDPKTDHRIEARPDARHVESPLVLVEVLSPSTEINDRGVKLPEYLLLPSLEGALLVSSTERRVQLWRREGDHWIVQDLIGQAEVVLPRLSSPIPLSAMYLNVAV
jgi:hypothetical protein